MAGGAGLCRVWFGPSVCTGLRYSRGRQSRKLQSTLLSLSRVSVVVSMGWCRADSVCCQVKFMCTAVKASSCSYHGGRLLQAAPTTPQFLEVPSMVLVCCVLWVRVGVRWTLGVLCGCAQVTSTSFKTSLAALCLVVSWTAKSSVTLPHLYG